MSYIEREALLSAAKGYDWIAGLKTVMKRIPAADVREVVRGKDTKTKCLRGCRSRSRQRRKHERVL